MLSQNPPRGGMLGCCCEGPCEGHGESQLSRRGLLRAGFAGAAIGVAAGAGLMASRPAFAQSTLSPDAALKQLMDGNRRFVEKKMTSFDEDLGFLKQNTAEKQE